MCAHSRNWRRAFAPFTELKRSDGRVRLGLVSMSVCVASLGEEEACLDDLVDVAFLFSALVHDVEWGEVFSETARVIEGVVCDKADGSGKGRVGGMYFCCCNSEGVIVTVGEGAGGE